MLALLLVMCLFHGDLAISYTSHKYMSSSAHSVISVNVSLALMSNAGPQQSRTAKHSLFPIKVNLSWWPNPKQSNTEMDGYILRVN